MLSAPYKKALRDLIQDRTRAVMVMLALLVGIWGLASVLGSTTVLQRELRDNFLNTHPPSAVVWVDGQLDAAEQLRSHPDIAAAERRDKAVLRMLVGPDEWLPLWLYVVEDFNDLQVSTFKLESGRLPQTGDLLLERDGLQLLAGEEVSAAGLVVKVPGGERQRISMSGLVHDPGRSPSHMDHRLYAYVSRATANQLGVQFEQQRVMFTVREDADREEAIRAVVLSLGPWLADFDASLARFHVPPPLKHPHAGQLASLLMLQTGLGGLAFLLSGVLIITMFSSLLSRQVRQIGVMKAVGARPSQLVGPYLAMVLVPTMVAMVFAIPGGLAMAWGYSTYVAAELNFDLDGGGPPMWVVPVTVLGGVGLAISAAVVPVLRGTRIGVLEALRSDGVAPTNAAALARLPVSNRIVKMALRNSLRNRNRMLLTAFALALGVGTLLVGLDTSASLGRTIGESNRVRSYDVEMVFTAPVAQARVEQVLSDVPGVVSWDHIGGGRASIQRSDGASNRYAALAPQTRPQLAAIEGVWGDGFVVNQELRGLWPELQVGEALKVDVGGRTLTLTFDGVVKEIGSPPRIYLPQSDAFGTGVLAIQVQNEHHDIPAQQAALRDLERLFEEAGVPVAAGFAKAERLQIIEDHLIVLTSVLTLASLFVLGVGGLGVTSTMSIRLLERRRELAVMRSIGATPAVVTRLLAFEGVIVGVLGWSLGALVSVPVAMTAARLFGELILETPLSFAMSWTGLVGSAVLVVAFTAVVSAVPTWAYSQVSIREALTHE